MKFIPFQKFEDLVGHNMRLIFKMTETISAENVGENTENNESKENKENPEKECKKMTEKIRGTGNTVIEKKGKEMMECEEKIQEIEKTRDKNRERIEKNPKLKELYEKMEKNYRFAETEQLAIDIQEAMDNAKDSNEALKVANSLMFKEIILERGREPAKPNELINYENNLGREQLLQITEIIGINFEDLNFTKDQLIRFTTLYDVIDRCEGMTYLELGLLDEEGNVVKSRVEELIKYEGTEKAKERLEEREDDQTGGAREVFDSFNSVNKILQERCKKKFGEEGKLPVITINEREYDLNEIKKGHEEEINKFSEIYEDLPEQEKIDVRKELPKKLNKLMTYRFNESGGAADEIKREGLPKKIEIQLTSLGLQEIEVNRISRGEIRMLSFKYKGEKMELSIGKYGGGDDKTPYLHIYDDNQRIQSRQINIANIADELESAAQYKKENQSNIDEINKKFFGKKEANSESLPRNMEMEYVTGGSVLSAKERMLGSVKEPDKSDRKKFDDKEILGNLDKVMPIILANQAKLRITDDMTIMEAMIMVYNSKNSKETNDYKEISEELKDPNSRYYFGVEPIYGYKEEPSQEKDTIKESRRSQNPEYIQKKERLAEMKKGDEIKLEFKGKSYTFQLEDSLANYEYKFKLKGDEESETFIVNRVDLVKSTPEERLKYLLGKEARVKKMDAEKLLSGEIPPDQMPKQIHLDHKFSKGEIRKYKNFKNLPLEKEERKMIMEMNELDNLGKDKKFKMELNTDRYGRVDNVELKWEDNEGKKYRLKSDSGSIWRLRTLEKGSGNPKYAFYDTRTGYVEEKVKEEMKEK